MPKYQIDVEAALDELKRKGKVGIEIETALKWASRAKAASRLPGVSAQRDAIEFKHEALEHAVLSGQMPLVADLMEFLKDI